MGDGSGDDHARAVEALARAPFEDGAWMEAIGLFARIGGGWSGQLLGIDLTAGIQFNLISGMGPTAAAQFEQAGGAIVGVNPRSASVFQKPFDITADDDFAVADVRRRSPIYRELFEPNDAPFISMARLPDHGPSRVTFSAIRSRTQGHAQAEDHARIAALLPHADAALRMQAAFNARELNASVRALDALSIAAFLCDRWGRAIALTAAADGLVRRTGVLSLRRGTLIAMGVDGAASFQRELDLACRPAGPGLTVRGATLALRDAQHRVRRIDISPIARAIDGFPPSAVAIVGVTEVPRVTDRGALLRQGYGLTAAEAAVALDIAAGYSSSEIAVRRGARSATVRVQIKAVLAKTGQTKSTALAALIARLTG